MSDNGWINYMMRPAPRGILCRFERRGESTCRWVGVGDDFAPEFNVAGLYWRLTGIGREQMDAMNPQQRAMIEQTNSYQQFANALMPSAGQGLCSGVLGRYMGDYEYRN